MIIAVIGLSYSLRETIATSIENFHAERQRTDVINAFSQIYLTKPSKWFEFLDSTSSDVGSEIVADMREIGVTCVAILDTAGTVIFSGAAEVVCSPPRLENFAEVLENGQPELREDLVGSGLWTTLIAIQDPPTRRNLLVALSQPSRNLESAIGRLSNPQTLIFGSVFIAACAAALWLIYKAQAALDRSFDALNAARMRMQRFLSIGARENALQGGRSATRHDAVVLFADIRNFSGFADSATIEQTADLIDRFVTVVTMAVEAQGGDVDKLLGDGVLAWFEGPQAEERAARASVECIRGCRNLQRRPGIGLYRGEIISAVFGRGDRTDFTILGRAVNLAARLCSASAENQITVPASLIDLRRFGLVKVSEDSFLAKNHREPVSIIKYLLEV